MTTTRPGDLSEFATFAIDVAHAAGAVVMAQFSAPMSTKRVEFKAGPSNLVTQADRDAEQAIVDRIHRRYPAHGILGEEGTRRPGDEFLWILDPIDGTTNYAHGVPWFAVSIALVHRDRVTTGVVYRPAGEELFVAERGTGAFVIEPDGLLRRLAVTSADRMPEALVGVGLPAHPERTRVSPALTRLSELTREIRVMGSAALHLADVAAGRLDAFVEPNLSTWDIAAGVLLVQEAGGRVTDFSGGTLAAAAGGDVAASNGLLHDTILEIVGRR